MLSHSSFRITIPKVPLFIVGLLFFGFCEGSHLHAQEIDSVAIESRRETFSQLPKDPRKATILSAVLPGAGQVYNNKAWKVPLIYGGIMTDIYFIGFNSRRYVVFRQALRAFDVDGESNIFPNLNRESLVRNVNYWRTNRDLTYLLLGLIYALNVVDANVDAHLSGFDISDDLALDIKPHFESFSSNNNSVGVSLSFKF